MLPKMKWIIKLRRSDQRRLTNGNWNPVLESHQPLRFCRPLPELISQRDIEIGCERKPYASARSCYVVR
jgi:hypothetical protein